MDLRLGIVTGASLLLVVVKPDPNSPACTRSLDLSSPCGCTLSEEIFDPVCGSDGFTYLGPCFLECRKVIDKIDISIRHEGACHKESLCTCPAEYTPICGSNNVTYSNNCVLNCFMRKDKNIRFKHDGECGRPGKHGMYDDYTEEDYGPAICRCPSNAKGYRPQHGGHGNRQAHSNCDCQRKKKLKNVVKLANEVKTVKSPCSAHQMQSRPNQSAVQKLNLVVSDKCRCAAVHAPVCDHDHKTYANFCVLYCSTRKHPNIKLLHWGDCRNTL